MNIELWRGELHVYDDDAVMGDDEEPLLHGWTNSAVSMRVTDVRWSILQCSCGEMVEELRQEVVYGED
jgi:hypothetical protein